MTKEYDYDKLGFKAGLEIHQQLNTQEKLFCGCPTQLRDTKYSTYQYYRYLRPTRSEMGEVDRAALEEVMHKRKFVYMAYDTTCLVENDEEPPRELNKEAIAITLLIARLFNMDVFDEIHTMRKIVIDGSNTSGFQRTALVSTNGYMETSQGNVGVSVLCLEEEAAQRIEDKADHVVFSIDRLGIPLVEIGTDPDIRSPLHARETAELIGMLLRSTGKVKRGQGTIRQDVNVSIARGARVEIKGVQALDLIETIVEREVERQVNLLEIMDELQKRDASIQSDIIDVTHLFVKTRSEVIKKALKKGVVLAVNLHGFAGLVGREIQPGRRLGSELSDYAKKSGVGGIFHTDELPKYGITAREIEALRQALNAKVEDCMVLVADLKERAFDALQMVVDRSRFAMNSVPEETRKALPDGNSAYMRPLPGAARMYPETDVPPVVVTHEMLHDIVLPELLPARKARYMKDHSLNEELAERVAFKHFELFEDILSGMGDTKINVTLIASTLVNTLIELRRDGSDVKKLDTGHYVDVFKLIASGDAAKEVVPDLLFKIIEQPGISAQDAAQQLGLGTKRKEDIETMVDEIISRRMDFIAERGLGAVGPLMGLVMKEMRGSVDGKVVSDIVTEKIKNILS